MEKANKVSRAAHYYAAFAAACAMGQHPGRSRYVLFHSPDRKRTEAHPLWRVDAQDYGTFVRAHIREDY